MLLQNERWNQVLALLHAPSSGDIHSQEFSAAAISEGNAGFAGEVGECECRQGEKKCVIRVSMCHRPPC